jgi:hypothetical protein
VSILNVALPSFEWYVFLSWFDFQVPHVILYVAYFALGIVAYERRWLHETVRFGPLWLWLAILAAATVVAIWTYELWVASEVLQKSSVFLSAVWLDRAVLIVASLAVSLNVTQRHFNKESTVHQHLAANSYRMYLLHIIVLVPLQFAFLQWASLPPVAVFVVVAVASLIGTYLLSVLVGFLLRRVGLGWVT